MSLKRLLSEISSGWKKAKNEQFTGHPIATLLRQDLISIVKAQLDPQRKYLIKASAGAGNWADVPWLSILNPVITESIQSGIYPVYLFRADGSGVYLSLGFGANGLKKQHGTVQAKQKAKELRQKIRNSDPRLNSWDDEIDIRSSTALGQSYEWASAGAKFYPVENIPEDSVLITDLLELLEIYDDVSREPIQQTGHTVLLAHPLSKPFLLLAGISGTGKTRFVREQAKATGQFNETYCLVSVRPDWHEPSDLLGYISRLANHGQAEYITTDVLQFIAKAWRGIADNGLSIEVQHIDEQGERLVVTGDRDALNEVLPYWLCLDEMNLAPVEQYFADYLSVLETREWRLDGDAFTYSSDALLKPAMINAVADTDKLRKDLGFEAAEYDELWQLICEHGLAIPFNLMVAGTVNMDETTHGFSRKVIDRALSFDFGEFFPNDYAEFFEPTIGNKALSYPVLSHANYSQDKLPSIDSDGQKSIDFLDAVNTVLDNTPFRLAYRALNELLLAVISEAPDDQDTLHLQAIWDDFLMCKVLPRIEGDSDKLMTDDSQQSLLQKLSQCLTTQLAEIWNEAEGAGTARPDLYREKAATEGDAKVLRIACRSKAKLEWMQKRLERSGFTSFWP